MSDKDSEQPLDLSSLQLAPDWVSSLDSGSSPDYKDLENVDYTERKGGKGRGKGGGQGRNRPGGGDRRGRGQDRRGPGGGGDRQGQRRDGQGQGQGQGRRGPGGGDRRGQEGGGDRRRGQGGGDRGGRGGDQRGGDRRGGRFGNRDRQPLELPPGLGAKIAPNPAGIRALAQTIKRSGRTFGLIDIAKLIVGGRERYDIVIAPSKKQKQDTPAPKLTRCKTDGSLWLSREEAARHLIDSGIIEQNYGVEEVQVDPPKGNFTGIAVCGISGTLLGPPNHHSYLENVLKLHRERFSTWNLEKYKSRIRVETGEEIVEKWKAEQSTRTEWVFPKPAEAKEQPVPETAADAPAAEAPATDTPAPEPADATSDAETPTPEEPAAEAATTETPNADAPTEEAPADDQPADDTATADAPTDDTSAEETPAADAPAAEQPASDTPAPDAPEPIRFTKRADLERHARETFADAALEEVESATIPGNIPGKLLSPLLLNLVKSIGEHSRRSPAVLIAPLCDLLGEHGLKFFRWGGKQLFTSHTRPRQLNSETPMGAEIRAIFDFVRANPNTKPQNLLDHFAPTPETPPAPATEPQTTPAPAEAGTAAPDTAAAPEQANAEQPADGAPAAGAPAPEAPPAQEPAAEKPAAAEAPPLTPQQIKVLQHLRWLVGEGYIVEFADGRLDAVRVRTVKPEPEAKPAAPATPSTPAAETPAGTPATATADSPSPDPVSEHAPDPGLSPQTDPDLPNDPGLPADLEP